ncbi:MAG: hypothetical protein AAF762_05535 [Pseudomonadota bacterium]
MSVEIGDDFQLYRSLRNAQTDRSGLYPMFDVSSSYVDGSNGFWICGFNSVGEIIHTQAVRLLDIGTQTLRQHLSDHRHKYITPDTTPDPDKTCYEGPQALSRVTGKVCYQGDFWLPSRGLGGPRSQGATQILSRLLHEMVYHAWRPDYMFALVPERLAAKGAHLRYGYTHCEPGRWIGPDAQVTEKDYLIWMSRADMAHQIAEQPVTLSAGSQISPVAESVMAIDTKG